jgi:hypothetical protein
VTPIIVPIGRGGDVKFLILGYTPAESWDAATADTPSEDALAAFAEYQRFEAELRATGEFVSAEGLGVSSLDRAKDIVARMVAVLGEPMEIRPIMGEDFAA